jgi:hypothetical protein
MHASLLEMGVTELDETVWSKSYGSSENRLGVESASEAEHITPLSRDVFRVYDIKCDGSMAWAFESKEPLGQSVTGTGHPRVSVSADELLAVLQCHGSRHHSAGGAR